MPRRSRVSSYRRVPRVAYRRRRVVRVRVSRRPVRVATRRIRRVRRR